MANTLTSLIPDLYESLDVVSRELVGFIPSVTLDAAVARAALNQNVRSFVTPAVTAEDILWRRSKLGLHVSPETVETLERYLPRIVREVTGT